VPQQILPDSSVFIRGFRRRVPYQALLGRYGDDAIYFLSSVVGHELYLGARTESVRHLVDDLWHGYEGEARLLTPSAEDWAEAGRWLAEVRNERGAHLSNDCLIAVTAWRNDLVVVSENTADFALLASIHHFDFEALS
jgi:predicted nucleic acid-binding protein